jgi:nucleotide-binding universal stress UspA family protein
MLFSIKRILVCTDLSHRCDDVLIDAEILRKRLNAQADILFVSDIGLHFEWNSDQKDEQTFYGKFIEKMKKDLKNNLNSQIERTGIQGNVLFAEGSIVHEINDIILNGPNRYDLLMIGHSRKGIQNRHLTLGSVARKIVSNVSLPTMVVKKKLEFNTLAALVNGSRPLEWMVATSMDLYRLFNYKKIEFISLLHDLPEPFKNTEELKEFTQKLQDDVEYLSREKDNFLIKVLPTKEVLVAHHLGRIMQEDQVDLAVVKRNRGKRFNQKILGSVTLRLLELDTCNILVMPI